MAATSKAQPLYVFDADALINLQRTSRIRILAGYGPPGSGLVVPHRVFREVTKSRRRNPLTRWLDRGTPARFIGKEGQLYLQLLQAGLGDGEAAALGMAFNRGGTLVSRDKMANREAKRLRVRSIFVEELLEELKPRLL